MNRIILLLCILTLFLSACSTTTGGRRNIEGAVPLDKSLTEIPEPRLLNVSIEVFDPGELPKDEKDANGLSKDIREAESRYLPEELRATMEKTGYWGAVRVVPRTTTRPMTGGELTVSGTILESTGGGNFFIELAYALTGRFSGGPAKTSVIASGFMGSISGSAVGNVVATGSFTIPMMKKVGYRPHVAGAIEAAASTGGQLMPPIMGAGAFLMAEFTNTSYLTIIKVALIPAIMYYLTVLFFVHYEAKKYGLEGQPKENLPRFWLVVKEGLHFIIPVIILIYVLVSNYSPMMAGFVAVMSTMIASLAANAVRWALNTGHHATGGSNREAISQFCFREFKTVVGALEKGAKSAVMVSVACAAAGIIVGMVTLTGMGLKFSSLVLDLSFGIKALAILLIGAASLVLGMGLPVTASYIVLATLAGPALLDMGVPIMVAHMIVFWYSQDANVTPPVSLASFAGAGIAGANPMRTAFTSWKLAKGLYIIPIIMAYRPLLGVGENYDLLNWEVGLTMVVTTLGLVAFASGLERYFLRRATWPETILFWIAAAGLFWPAYWADIVGLVALVVVVLLQKFTTPNLEISQT